MTVFQVERARAERTPRALLVAVHVRHAPRVRTTATFSEAEALEELEQLVRSAGLEIAATSTVRRDRPDPALYIGSGKAEELAAVIAAAQAGLAIFDAALSPVQQRNLERALGVQVIDRTALILDIFAQRAKSSEGRLQVELAQLEHLATRLVRGWTHLERQRGGIGLRGGPGETQLELDRRMIGVRVKQLRERLKTLHRQRSTQRRSRGRSAAFTVCLVGYTNAGKSTLFNALARAGAHAADQLFATLETTSRRCMIGPNLPIVLSDTVGFIRGLPHELVEAFKSTLDEVVEADLLLHVVDAASPSRDAQLAEVERVLDEIGAGHVPRLEVFNKMDRLGEGAPIQQLPCDSITRVFVSAATGDGLLMLRGAIARVVLAARDRPDLMPVDPSLDPCEPPDVESTVIEPPLPAVDASP